jgi:hypothetical protein
MLLARFRCVAVFLLAGCAAACAGNGQGLDANGQPISSGNPGGPLTADFQSIQDNVFTPICAPCHSGASAPEGLQLDAGHSYNLLVGVASAEQPNLLRVKAGDPDSSYMVQKIEGLASISGDRMPRGEPPLLPATIDTIRQWIANGAQNAPAAAAAQMFAVQTTAPVNKAIVAGPLTRVVVTFTQDVDASLVNETTVTLERVGGDAQVVPATAALAANNPAVLLITPRAALGAGSYRITLRGTGGGALANMNAATLGADSAIEFTVERAQ